MTAVPVENTTMEFARPQLDALLHLEVQLRAMEAHIETLERIYTN